jgi:sulfur carrier protein
MPCGCDHAAGRLKTVFPGLRGASEYGFFMKIRINGEEKEVREGQNIEALLSELQIRPARVVVELNRRIISQEAHGSTALKDGDSLEIVHFVGGG